MFGPKGRAGHVAVHTVSIYLLKESTTGPSDALRPTEERADSSISEHRVEAGETTGTLFLSERDPRTPSWMAWLQQAATPPIDGAVSGFSGVLVLQAAGRWFAVTFGGGRHLLDRASYERRFGLKVTLNTVDPERLRGAQSRTFSSYALHVQRQLSRLSTVEALELDVQRDLVTALDGVPANESVGKRIEGRDAVRLTADIEVHQLSAKCAELYAQSRLTRYQDAFPWIDTIEEITDPTELEAARGKLTTALGQRAFQKFDLFPPELVSDDVVEYRLWPRPRGQVVIEPDARLLRFPLNVPMSPADAEKAVRRFTLIGVDSSGNEAGRWSFWDCLHYESQENDVRLILDNGTWYRIKRDFVNEVETFVAGLSSSGLNLPAARRGEHEPAYNKRASREMGAALLDSKNIRLPEQTAVEPCDIFTSRRQMVHVKKRDGGSGPLSHLLGQAWVASELLVSDARFRDALRDKLRQAHPGYEDLIDEPVDARDVPVVLALITGATAAGPTPARSLPFFTKVFLRQVVRHLQAMNFSVYVDEIPTPLIVPPQRERGRTRPRPAPAVADPSRQG